MLLHLMFSLSSLILSSFLFILFFLFCSTSVISNILSSSSLIHSSASFILLLIHSSAFFISVIVLIVSGCSLDFLTPYSYSLSILLPSFLIIFMIITLKSRWITIFISLSSCGVSSLEFPIGSFLEFLCLHQFFLFMNHCHSIFCKFFRV